MSPPAGLRTRRPRDLRARDEPEQLVSGTAEVGAWTDRLWKAIVRSRYLMILTLAVAALLVPAVGPNRVQLGLSLLLGGPVYNLGLHLYYRSTGRIPWIMPFSDVAVCVAISVQEPRSFVPTLLVLVAVVALAASTQGRRRAAGSAVMASIGMSLSALVAQPEDALVDLIGFAIVAATVIVTVGLVSESESRLRARYGSIVEGLDAIVWESDSTGLAFTYASPRAKQILGYPVEAWVIEGFWAEHLHRDDRDAAVRIRTEAISAGGDHECEYRMVAADGRSVHFHDVMSVTVDASGHPSSAHGVMIDISERRQAEERMHQYADIVESIELGLVVLRLEDRRDDQTLRLMAANPAATAAMQRPLDQLLGHPFDQVFPALLHTSLNRTLAEVVRRQRAVELEDLVVRDGRPDRRVLRLRAFPLPGEAVGVSLEDVTSASVAANALRRQALHDGLTSLPNRIMLNDRLKLALREAQRTGRSVALLVMDLDQFKEVNDALGHHCGDLLLIGLAERLEGVLREADVIARLGGDEFAVLLTTDVTLAGAVAVADKIDGALQEPFEIDELRLQTGVSIGIALFPEHAEDAETLAQRADVAMYVAKRNGIAHAVYASEADKSSVRRLTLLSDFRRAIESDEFVLHFQPVVDFANGEPVQAEALVRWDHPEHGLMAPEDFIELAELSGFIRPLTRWVLERAVAVASNWWCDGHRLGVAVNLSVRNLYDPSLPKFLRGLLETYGLPPDQLILELTESELMDDPALALQVLGEVNRLGIATAVDDFGTGYSSLSYLKDLPIREIKIDKSFVGGMRQRSDDLTIVRSMIDLGHNLGLEVVAEGVEDGDLYDQLAQLGCDLAQGFHVTPPLSAADLRAWLAARPSPEFAKSS